MALATLDRALGSRFWVVALLGCSAAKHPPARLGESVAETAPMRSNPCVELAPLIVPLIEREWTPSVSIAWLEAGQRKFCSFGQARADGNLTTPDTLYEIGSLTKLFTGVLLGSLLADGSVRLDQPVAELVPAGTSIPSFEGRKVTLLHLATHRSALPRMPTNVAPSDPENPYANYDNTRLFAYLASAKLSVPPGSEHRYSNLGAALLGQALAARAKRPYEELVRARILEPLGMRDTYFSTPASASERLAIGHDADGVPHRMWDFNAFSPAGGLCSSARDMARFAAAALKTPPGLLGRAVQLATTARADAAAGRRIGLFFQTRPDGVHWHNGSTGGFSSYMALNPGRAAGLVVLSSSSSTLTDALGDRILQFQSGAPLEPLDLPQDSRLTPSELAEYEGKYALSETFLVHVFRRNHALYAQASGQEAIRIWPSGNDHFYFRVVDARLTFDRDSQRKISALVLDQDGTLQRAARQE